MAASSGARVMIADFLMELFASFFFALVAGLSYDGSILVTAFAIGLACAIFVSAEETEMNPVVSIALALCHSKSCTNLAIRLGAQLIGFLLGGLAAIDGFRDQVISFSERTGQTTAKCFVFEIVFSLILVLIVLRTRKLTSGAFTHGFCYSIAILCGYLLFDGNALVNPMMALGLLVGSSAYDVGSTDESYIWLYLVGPFIGCLLAVLFYWLTEYLLRDSVELVATGEEFVRGVKYQREKQQSEDEDETTAYVPRNQPPGQTYGRVVQYQRPRNQPPEGPPYQPQRAEPQPNDEDETTEYARGPSGQPNGRGVQHEQPRNQPPGGPPNQPQYQQRNVQPRGHSVGNNYQRPPGAPANQQPAANYQQPPASNYQQSPAGNYQRPPVSTNIRAADRNYQQPGGTNYTQPRNQQPMLRQRRVNPPANERVSVPGYPQQAAYGQNRYAQPQTAANRYVQ